LDGFGSLKKRVYPTNQRNWNGTMAVLETSAECLIRVDNKEIKFNISGIYLDQFIDNHHQLTVRIQQVGKTDAKKDFEDPANYTKYLGHSIALNIRPTGGVVDEERELEFIGMVTDVHLENSIDGLNTVILHAASPTISMDGAAKYAHFNDQSASDIIGSIVRNYPITVGTIESTSGKYKFDTQYRETDFDYIMGLSKAVGMFAYYNGKEFNLTKSNGKNVKELLWRETLGSFKLGLGTAPLNFKANVYNYEQKKIYTQDSKSLPQEASLSTISDTAPKASQKIFKESGYSTAPKSVEDAQSLDKTLQNERGKAMGSMIRCTGRSIVPEITVGNCVKINGMDKLDGQYWVKGVRHIFDESGKYHNVFTCTPQDIAYPDDKKIEPELNVETITDSTVSSSQALREIKPKPKMNGLYVARVVDQVDPLQLGRIKVSYPWLDAEQTAWVRLATPHAGQDRGWYSLPEIGDEVLIGFEQGSSDYPIAIGCLYNKTNAPMAEAISSDNDIKMFMTRSGNKLLFNDKDGGEQIVIAQKDGKNQITLDLSGPSITIKSEGDITINGANMTIEAAGGVTWKADSDFKVEAANIELKASANIKSQAGANNDVEGSAQVNVKGGMINLN